MEFSKKVLALCLSIALVSTSVTPAFAATYTENSTINSTYNTESEGYIINSDNEPQGVKGKAAKVVAKIIKKGLVKIGKDKWDNAVKAAVKALPIADKTKNGIITVLGYKTVADLADFLLDFQGKAEDGMQAFFESIGIDSTVAYWAAKTISFIFL